METPKDFIAQAYPDGFTLRDEANAIVAFAIRNSQLEDLHAGKHSSLLEDESLSRISEDEMKSMMIEFCERVEMLLKRKEEDPEQYKLMIQGYGSLYCQGWNRN